MINNFRRYTSDNPRVVFLLMPQVEMLYFTASARDLFAHKDLGNFTNHFSAEVKPLSVMMVKLSPAAV